MRGVDLFQIRNLGTYHPASAAAATQSAMVCQRLDEILASAGGVKPSARSTRTEPPRYATRVPGVEKNIALGLELLKLRSAIKNNAPTGDQVRQQFDVDDKARGRRAQGGAPLWCPA